MSEQLRPGAESTNESIDVSAESEANLKRLQEAAKKQPEATGEVINSLESAAKSEAISGKEVTVGEQEAQHQTSFGVHRELKQVAYKRSMERIRSSLSAPERILSKVIHNPVADTISNGVAKTVARPKGMFLGALAALIGSTALLFYSRYYGVTYNYTAFVVLYICGYALGLIVEAMGHLIRRKH